MGGFIDSIALSLAPVAALLLIAGAGFWLRTPPSAKWFPDEPGADPLPSADRNRRAA
ncbi:hypothetical protein [Streptomyces mesophilus]|uniref:hypothetical protein n=1 Tax=Streptomyces mesophilus TaxID=1775132 RepID=UPI003324D1AA